ncbi:hypothetical protein LTR10_020147 [Elasticomyces elasticus]|uniref:DUF7580 domain-containing protein n=1 Tax=Exophiala sideris TaxID=1016849 RepID=A0ABR0IWE1_9EURO|nr:hypothetical protein LTR10_020147 [Elasticomyces elasticus]KAK5021608.1 hypothetical protein LTS07_010905 [Exophiala sideris]KAK5024759.1 hypothetical protein LTR13_010728 [Exophiala sideris]KAK5049745.1 hypothetical protein LTR69_010929 [Exophiala sideris]KAK5176726.1 hypothetical protein LTR44_010796 [Eurotiomycetes sp. CCFEE 6388]
MIISAAPPSETTYHAPKRRKMPFTTAVNPSYQAVPEQVPQATSACQKIADMCSALHTDQKDDTPKGFFSVVEGAETEQRAGPHINSRTVSRRDRLMLAATLASSVLQYQGSWLKPHWRSRDVLLTRAMTENRGNIDRFYLSGHKVDPTNSSNVQRTTQDVLAATALTSNRAEGARESPILADAPSSEDESPTDTSITTRNTHRLIRCELLFPLGLTLVELSLCQSMASLRLPEDNDADRLLTDLKTAARVLDSVYSESGCRYGDVVDQCLFGLRSRKSKGMDLEDEKFQRIVYEEIVSPLLDDLKDFEGRGPIR